MIYISSIKGKHYGVTDTDDGIEEFYTEAQVKQFVIEFETPITGVITNDEGVAKIVVTSPQIEEIANYGMGTAFEIHKGGEVFYYIKMDNVGTEGFHVYDSDFHFVMLNRNLLMVDSEMEVMRCNDILWYSDFKKWFKRNQPLTYARLFE